ncbi:MAG TPA: hypothetical protein PLS49_07305 [Candidatus Woesebacteria bacterium]|nr:hypothetical protein [Candidatus Woesebacteria bacterium]
MKKENIFLVLGIVTIIGFFALAFYYMRLPPEPEQTALTPTPSIQMDPDNFNPNYGNLTEDQIQIADMAIGKLLNSVEGITPAMVIVKDVSAQDFNDASLGCPKPEEMYAQVITPGYQVLLEVQGTEYDYRLTDQDNVILCEQ